MDCPRCTIEPRDKTGPYRRSAEPRVDRPALAREQHASGVEIDRCPSCGGAWLQAGELQRIENHARGTARSPGFLASVEQVKRAYAHAHRPEAARGEDEEPPPLACPGCGEVMFPREWSHGTLVEVDVCIDCRGVWLDPGELEAIEQIFARQ